MSPLCEGPDASQGIALRLSQYVSCEARVLGENGFQALAGGPIGTSLLTGLVTIFVALIGYRMLLGSVPSLRDGVGWAVRLGIVLALVTSWPAFQTLVYRVAAEGPFELASVILPASGLPSSDLSSRVQNAYDTMRLGTVDVTDPAAASSETPKAPQLFKFQVPLPNTASLFVMSTLGLIAALQIAIGFLLAVAPLPLMSLLFSATSGLFTGWLRTLAGAAFAMLAATIVTALDVIMVESELGRLERLQIGSLSEVVDPQALTTIVALFALVIIILLALSMKVASALALPTDTLVIERGRRERSLDPGRAGRPSVANEGRAGRQFADHLGESRVTAVAEILTRSMHREQATDPLGPGTRSRPARTAEQMERGQIREPSSPLGLAGRRHQNRRSGSAARRDQRH